MSDDIDIDATSLLVGVAATKTLKELQTSLIERGFTLGVEIGDAPQSTVGDWLSRGAPGASSPFADPADHLVAGLLATLSNGTKLEVRPCPRRAVGPDLVALFVGMGERIGAVEHAWLRIHRCNARRPALELPRTDLDPPIGAGEALLLDSIERELQRV